MTTQAVPHTIEMPMLPLRGLLVFPHMVTHLDVGRERSINAIDEAMLNSREIFLAMQKEAQVDDPNAEDIYQMGTVAEIKQILELPGGTVRILVQGLYRAKVQRYLQSDPYMLVELSTTGEDDLQVTTELAAMMRSLQDKFDQYVKVNKKIAPEAMAAIGDIAFPGQLADVVASHLNLPLPQRQEVLETVDLPDRYMLLLGILEKEMEILDLDRKINNRVRRQMEQSQKEYYLREQIKAIQKELGDKDDRAAEVEELQERIDKAKLPKMVQEKVAKELDRLSKMPPMVAEAMVVRNYIDWLLDLPWTKQTKDRLDINEAEEILNEDHYGLEKAKERILEYLAVRQLTKQIKGPILCLVGPPGVGKTSLARSIARSIGRKFVRISLGGMRDEAEIRGHRRTYVGAMPGRIIQGMKTAGSKNPLFLLDEIDKLASDFRGDPASALLEVLDPEQNCNFSDHYVEIPYDLSKVMFITTANVGSNIPRPLLDRMEVIQISGYTEEEKVEIAKRHLLPKEFAENGLKLNQIEISENAIRSLIREYTREAGVRSLERAVAKICRQVARDIVAGKCTSAKVTSGNIQHYMGIPRYRYQQAEQEDQVGVVTGLAWTEVGGEILAVEVQTLKGKGKMTLTGQLGDVMKESAQAGFTYIRSIAQELGIPENIEETTDFHIHVPEGAIPKDGPSAGVTMATALASELSGRPVRHDVAMTGEITLRGRVLPVGGIKEKVLAAHRSGYTNIILPAENEKDLEDLPANIRKKLTFHLVRSAKEVLDIALLPAGQKETVEEKTH